jgi:hypothetical protein
LINDVYPNYITLGRSSSYQARLGVVSMVMLVQMVVEVHYYNRKLNTKIIVGHYHSPGRKMER